MSKRAYISRYLLILKKLKAKSFSTYEEVQTYIDGQLEYMQLQDDTLNIGFSKRTMQRDIKDIRNVFGIDIEYSKAEKGYFIVQDQTENLNFQRRLEAFDLFNSLNIADELRPFVHLEKRRPQGTENLYGLLHAIKNNLKIKFDYHKFWGDILTQRFVEPYGLKEFRNRWYVLAEEIDGLEIKTFALDRMTNLEITNHKFVGPEGFDVEKSYKNCFGIIGPNKLSPDDVILSFNNFQGKYIKSLPLHASQKILFENRDELRISLIVYPTYDFIMELLSFGDNVKVIEPKSLSKEVKGLHKNAFEMY